VLDASDPERFDAGLETVPNEMDRWKAVIGAEHP
jgi:hypothetical protein